MKTKSLLILAIVVFLLYNAKANAQALTKVQTGVAIRASIDINGFTESFKNANYNISIVGGVGFHPFEWSFLYPSMHVGALLYNRGSNGSSYGHKYWSESNQFEILLNINVNGGFWSNNIDYERRRIPLYFFSDITANPLVNPFKHAFAVGTTKIWSFDRNKENQRIGFLNLLVDRRFQFNMYNDGSFFRKAGLGDGYDRYYTGGGQFSWHGDISNYFNDFELSFSKYTGFERGTFETANLLQIDFINFSKPETIYYNRNRLRFRMSSFRNNLAFHITAHNTDRDFQDMIHFKGDYTYFPDIFNNQWGLKNELKRLGIGASYLNYKSWD